MMNKNNSVHLPEDLVVEILSRVPTKPLERLRSTSKEWNALVKDGRFSKKHSANAPRKSLVIVLIDFRVYLVSVDLREIEDNKVALTRQFSLEDPYSNSSEEVDIRKVFHCDGLLLCTTKTVNLWFGIRFQGKQSGSINLENLSISTMSLLLVTIASPPVTKS
ncbi:unnamed protein product [Microthlaspi erraticum]|uniref:F-box domain-containing protein n=1 Tax=Microthlaspi erraticum TaxID=1685480 RepID=A0A6D2K5D2_9BRAS|nr:unnamed protein product [Microthlaspi erraticum]